MAHERLNPLWAQALLDPQRGGCVAESVQGELGGAAFPDHAGRQSTRLSKFPWLSTLPAPVGNTRSRAPVGHARRHAFNVVSTIGLSGMSRVLDSDFGAPNLLKRSARRRTCSTPFLRSMSHHSSPRSSDARNPVKIATKINGRQRSGVASMMRRSSSFVGMAGRARSRFDDLTGAASRTLFVATRPRRWASPTMAEREHNTRRAISFIL
jgi:hypothetical protein